MTLDKTLRLVFAVAVVALMHAAGAPGWALILGFFVALTRWDVAP